jgi:hypothetical protein
VLNRRAPYEYVRTFGAVNRVGELELNRPRSIHYWANEFYVADTGNNRCVVFSFDGVYQRSFATNPEPIMTVCPTNRLVVASCVTNTLQVFE